MSFHGQKLIRPVVLSVALLALMWPRAVAQTGGSSAEVDRVAKLKAAYILNFVKYTGWPAARFENAESPLIVTTVGDCDVHAALREGARVAGPIGGRRLVVQRLAYPRPDPSGTYDQREVDDFYDVLHKSHVAYFCSVEAESLRPVLQRVGQSNVLTVSDVPRFAESGGMLGLVIRENRMVFQANTGEIKKTEMTVSAKLLKWAEIVQTLRPAASAGTSNGAAKEASR